ncbi:hypothetical protein TNCV_1856761 [Trichonephila clavipes]|nr:hypothetical protein TNCV_1856761 [Trichonephila clavipes]
MPPSRQKNPTFVMPHIKVLSRHGIEDCFTVQMPKGKRLFSAYSKHTQVKGTIPQELVSLFSAAPYRRYQLLQVIFNDQISSQREAPELWLRKTVLRILILLRAPKRNRNSRDFSHAVYSYDMASVDCLHHESPPTWARVKPATLGAEGQRQTSYATQPAYRFP